MPPTQTRLETPVHNYLTFGEVRQYRHALQLLLQWTLPALRHQKGKKGTEKPIPSGVIVGFLFPEAAQITALKRQSIGEFLFAYGGSDQRADNAIACPADVLHESQHVLRC